MASPDTPVDTRTQRRAPFRPLFQMALREVIGGRALWTLLLLMCPLVGYSFFQALSLYGEASAADHLPQRHLEQRPEGRVSLREGVR